MKKLQIALIGIIGAVMVFLCVALGVSLSRGIPLAGGGNYSLVQEKKFPAQDIRSLKIDYGKGSSGSTDVLFYQGTGDEIIIREYMNYEPGQNQLSAIEQSGGELRITGAGHRFFSFLSISFRGAYVEVYLPAGFAGDMETLTVKTISGEISSKIGLTAQGGFLASTTSGDITLGQVTGSITLSTTSGEIKLEEGEGDLDAESTSGDIRVGSLAGSFRMSTTSGELTVSRAGSFGRAHSVSGDIRVFLEDLTGDLDISTTSGAVDLAFPGTADFRFRFSTTSGECGTFFDEALSFDRKGRNAEGKLGAGTHSVEISTVSGDLDIREFQGGDL